jgi:hypothetical protein
VTGVAEGASRQVVAWRLDRERLVTLTAAVAPGVPVIDASADAESPALEGSALEGSALEGPALEGPAPEGTVIKAPDSGLSRGRISPASQAEIDADASSHNLLSARSTPDLRRCRRFPRDGIPVPEDHQEEMLDPGPGARVAS